MKIIYRSFVILLAFLLVSNTTNGQTNEQRKNMDWANLKRFQKENSELLKTQNASNLIVLMGNSITEGWSISDPKFFSENPNLVNRGISGQTSQQMLLRFRQDVINLNPKIVVINSGTNDIAGNTGFPTIEEILNNIKSMAELAEQNNITVVIASILPASDFPWNTGLEPGPKIFELNKMLKEYCAQNKIIYLDFYSEMNDGNFGLKPGLSNDKVHPSLEGYKVMEPLLLAAIKKALEKY